MRSTHIVLTLVVTVILGIFVAVGYSIMIMPDEKLGQAYDKQRTSDFTKLASAIDAYYLKKNELPKNLAELLKESKALGSSSSSYDLGPAFGALNSLFSSLTIRDPQTNKPYTFKYSSQKDKDYELCTNFFAKGSAIDKAVDSRTPLFNDELSYDSSIYNAKQENKIAYDMGYNCVKLKVFQVVSTHKIETDSFKDYQDTSRSSSSSSSPTSARDSQRKSDLRNIKTALEAYHTDKGNYPQSLTELTTGPMPYRGSIPKDPKNSGVYVYVYVPDGNPAVNFVLVAHLENKDDKDIKTGTLDKYELTNSQ